MDRMGSGSHALCGTSCIALSTSMPPPAAVREVSVTRPVAGQLRRALADSAVARVLLRGGSSQDHPGPGLPVFGDLGDIDPSFHRG